MNCSPSGGKKQNVSEIALDASAVLALMMDEPGGAKVASLLPDAIMSAVNVAEVIAKIVDRDAEAHGKVLRAIEALGIEMVPFDADQALVSGALRSQTRDIGLSLGDRACLALAKIRNIPALTADRSWLRIAESVAVKVISIRN